MVQGALVPRLSSQIVTDSLNYTFSHWATETGKAITLEELVLSLVTKEVTYYAVYIANDTLYSVTFVDYNGDILQEGTQYTWGEVPTAPALTPTRAVEDGYTDTFAGWDKEIVAVAGDATYEARYIGAKIILTEEDDLYDAQTGAYQGIYDAAYHALVQGVAVTGADAYAVSYEVTGASAQLDADGIPEGMHAGAYQITATVTAGEKSIVLPTLTATIAKATLVLAADSYEITLGEDIPAFSYKVTGYASGAVDYQAKVQAELAESKIVFILNADALQGQAGVYDIYLRAPGSISNYEFVTMDGQLTLLTASVAPSTPSTPNTPSNPTVTEIPTTADVPAVVTAPASTRTPAPAQPTIAPALPDDTLVELKSEAVPLAPAADHKVEMEEAEIPLVATAVSESWALVNLLLAIGTVSISIVLLMGYFLNRRELAYQGLDDEDETQKYHGIFRALSVLLALLSSAIFLVTEDMKNPMVLVNQWTLVMALIALIQLAIVIKTRKDDDKMRERNIGDLCV